MANNENLYRQMRRDFVGKYRNKIVPFVQKYENKRKLKLLLAIIASGSLFVLGSLLLCFAFLHGGIAEKSNGGLLKLSTGLYVLSYFSWLWIKKDFENSIKEKIMPTVCSCFGNMKWSCNYYNDDGLFLSSCVVPNFTSKSYDDIFKGSYKDVKIEIAEAEYEIGSGKSRRIVFDGVIVKLNMNKNFISHTVINTNRFIKMSPSKNLHRTELEDVEFNKKFNVFTNDEVDARYLITTSFMERLKNMKTAFSANSVSCAFYNHFLIIALHTNRDLFSIGSLIKPICDEQQFFTMFEEILSIVKLIDHFKLDQKIGM